MRFGYYGFDWTYLVFVVPCFIFAMWAQSQVKSTFQRYSAVKSQRHLTGVQAAELVLHQNGITDVRIEEIVGQLTDHYDPRTNVIRLSSAVYGSDSVASVGVAAHEAGHAVQYAKGYGPIHLRAAIIPITNIGSTLFWPLFLMGLVLNFEILAILGIALFGFSTLFQLFTLPVELNASRRAIVALGNGNILTDDELAMAKKTLWAAAMTYVAALAASAAQLLRLLVLFGGRKRR